MFRERHHPRGNLLDPQIFSRMYEPQFCFLVWSTKRATCSYAVKNITIKPIRMFLSVNMSSSKKKKICLIRKPNYRSFLPHVAALSEWGFESLVSDSTFSHSWTWRPSREQDSWQKHNRRMSLGSAATMIFLPCTVQKHPVK